MKVNKYYEIARKASLDNQNHPGIRAIRTLIKKNYFILDVGCGEGSRINYLANEANGVGIDPSHEALKIAKHQYPTLKFTKGIGESLPFENNIFNIVYSAFAIEHCQNPKMFIQEMVRVCKIGGHIAILCPNYGSPNRRSPVSSQNPLIKLIIGIYHDIVSNTSLNWQKVTPKTKYDKIDDDTTHEPYLGSLIKFMNKFPLKPIIVSSLWELEQKPDYFYQKLFLFLGKLNIYPFRYWGPQLLVIYQKYA